MRTDLNALLPEAVHWLLMAGGAFLCYKELEAIKEKFSRDRNDGRGVKKQTKSKAPEELAAFEKREVSGAIRTDFILALKSLSSP